MPNPVLQFRRFRRANIPRDSRVVLPPSSSYPFLLLSLLLLRSFSFPLAPVPSLFIPGDSRVVLPSSSSHPFLFLLLPLLLSFLSLYLLFLPSSSLLPLLSILSFPSLQWFFPLHPGGFFFFFLPLLSPFPFPPFFFFFLLSPVPSLFIPGDSKVVLPSSSKPLPFHFPSFYFIPFPSLYLPFLPSSSLGILEWFLLLLHLTPFFSFPFFSFVLFFPSISRSLTSFPLRPDTTTHCMKPASPLLSP